MRMRIKKKCLEDINIGEPLCRSHVTGPGSCEGKGMLGCEEVREYVVIERSRLLKERVASHMKIIVISSYFSWRKSGRP